MERIFIFTGKGGVGKTSIAAAHAIKSAEEGKRTLLVSTDRAHNLGDIFEIQFGKNPKEVMENLDVYEIDPEYVMEHDYNDMMLSLIKLIPQGEERAVEGFGMLPGMEELFALLKINEIYQEGIYERIIVDCAPTGETLSLLKFPELLSWYMEKLLPIEKIAVRVLAPIAKQLYKVELPNKAAINDIEKIYLKLLLLQELLKNRETTSIRLVTLPEKMVVEETKRNYMYMNLYNFNVDGLYINRILPDNINNPFFDEWLMIQKKYKEQLAESFAAIPRYEIPWYDEELRGMKAVKRICKDALTKEDIFDAKIISQRESFEQNSKGYLMRISLPFVDKSKVDMYQSDSDIIIKINNFKRNIPLPNVFKTYRVTEAKMEESVLKIQFEKGDPSYE